jgi:hypothetical protein
MSVGVFVKIHKVAPFVPLLAPATPNTLPLFRARHAYPGPVILPTWPSGYHRGFVTTNTFPLVMFKIGGSFGGFHYGAVGYGGYPDNGGNIGPQVNNYSDFAGVFGTGVYVTGVAGTSLNNVGVYG